jgi:hypothetical protein
MGVIRIEVYPTCDIHLLLDGPGGGPTTFQLLVRDADVQSSAKADLTTHASTTITFTSADDGTPVIGLSGAGLITPVAVGEAFIRIRHAGTDDSDPQHPRPVLSEILVRVRVHPDIDDLWIGNNLATLYKGEDNYVLTVFAHFTDDTIGDVSSHPYLTFSSPQPTRVRVNDTDDKGRLTGVAVTPAASPVPVSVAYKAISRQVDVWVGPPLSQERPLMECIHGDPTAERLHVILLAEGFAQSQESLFRHLTGLVVDRLFHSELHAPFPRLKDGFNVWIVFDPSSEEGITPGSPLTRAGAMPGSLSGRPIPLDLGHKVKPAVPGDFDLPALVSRVGLPDRYRPQPATRDQAKAAWAPVMTAADIARVETLFLDEWLSMRDHHLMQAKDSRFAIMQGLRHGDQSSQAIDPAAPERRVLSWYNPSSPLRGLNEDRRRMSRLWEPHAVLFKYLESLRPNPAKHPSASLLAESGVPVVFANAAYTGGTRTGFATLTSVRHAKRYLDLQLTGRRTDHTPTELVPLPSFADLAGTSVEQLAAVVAHELGHGFSLGDEYDGFDFVGAHDALGAQDLQHRQWIQGWLNLTHLHLVHDPTGGPDDIDIEKVKWRSWHRVRQCSVLTGPVQVVAADHRRAPVKKAERRKWLDAKARGAGVFLRTRQLNADDTSGGAFFLKGPLTVAAVEDDGTVVLMGQALGAWNKFDILYEPEMDGAAPLTVFDPVVLRHLSTKPARPFGLKADVTQGDREPDFPPPAIAQGSPAFSPTDLAFVVGVYEGGGTFNSKVYRASGVCKMRNSAVVTTLTRPAVIDLSGDPLGQLVLGQPAPRQRYVPFCHVCQYALTNLFDPTLLVGLSYPR